MENQGTKQPYQQNFRQLLNAFAEEVETRVLNQPGDLGTVVNVRDRVQGSLRAGISLEQVLHQLLQSAVYITVQQIDSSQGRKLLEAMNIVPNSETIVPDSGDLNTLIPEATPERLFPLPPDTSYTKPGSWSPSL